MLIFEAALLASILDRLAPESVLDIGSGSRADREIIQPHIGAAFRGHNVTWADMVGSPGVVGCDITDRETLAGMPICELVTACSVLEHVTDIDVAIKNLKRLTCHWLIVSVPKEYPYHAIPIDNWYRPTAEELGERLTDVGLVVLEKYETTPENFQGVYPASASLVVAVQPNHT